MRIAWIPYKRILPLTAGRVYDPSPYAYIICSLVWCCISWNIQHWKFCTSNSSCTWPHPYPVPQEKATQDHLNLYPSLANRTLSFPQHWSLSVSTYCMLKATGSVEWNGLACETTFNPNRILWWCKFNWSCCVFRMKWSWLSWRQILRRVNNWPITWYTHFCILIGAFCYKYTYKIITSCTIILTRTLG